MSSLNFDSDRVFLDPGETRIVCSYQTGMMSSLLLRAEVGDIKLMAPGSADGITLKEGEPFSQSAFTDLSIVPAGQLVELRAKNLSAVDTAEVSYLIIGVKVA